MVRTHKRSKITPCLINDSGLLVMRNEGGYNRWCMLQGYVLQTELLNDDKDRCLVEYLEKQDADEYVNEKRYMDEIKRLTAELEVMETKLKVVEKAFAEQKEHAEWLNNENNELGKLLEEVRRKQEKHNKGEK